jgi:hypothetical protein
MSSDYRCSAGWVLTRGLSLVALVVGVSRCASGPPPAPATGATTEPAPAVEETAAAPESSPATTASVATAQTGSPQVAAASDTCHVSEQFALAYETLKPENPREAWLASARAKLLPKELAERVLTGIAQEVVSALAHRKYEKLAAFAPEDGICLRPAKGAACQIVSKSALAGCSASAKRSPWAVDDGRSDAPQYSCKEAFQKIFYARDFLHAKARFNCFPEPARGNNPAPVVLSGPRLGYVEFHTEGEDGFRSLWLVFDGTEKAPELVEMVSEYPSSGASERSEWRARRDGGPAGR